MFALCVTLLVKKIEKTSDEEGEINDVPEFQ